MTQVCGIQDDDSIQVRNTGSRDLVMTFKYHLNKKSCLLEIAPWVYL